MPPKIKLLEAVSPIKANGLIPAVAKIPAKIAITEIIIAVARYTSSIRFRNRRSHVTCFKANESPIYSIFI